jgi:hypothetical protein
LKVKGGKSQRGKAKRRQETGVKEVNEKGGRQESGVKEVNEKGGRNQRSKRKRR